MLEWLIVGGGIHGTYLARALTEEGRVAPDRVRVVDPQPRLLSRFFAQCEVVGVDYLRSPAVHHLDGPPMALFARARREPESSVPLRGRVARPALELFRAHSEEVVARQGLERLHVETRVQGLRRWRGGYRVETPHGPLHSRRVILAIGSGDCLCRPDWLAGLPAEQAGHVFDPSFDDRRIIPGQRVVVVGGGLSAAQAALRFAARSPGAVTLLSRHPPRIHEFDSDPCWMGPKCTDAFHRRSCFVERRRLLREARHRGSMPRELALRLEAAVGRGTVRLRHGAVASATPTPSGELRLELSDDGGVLATDHTLVATGYDPGCPGGPWLAAAIDALGLPTAPCGYPAIPPTLEWAPGLFVTGPLAVLEIGPVARNVLGARLAAERILAHAAADHRSRPAISNPLGRNHAERGTPDQTIR